MNNNDNNNLHGYDYQKNIEDKSKEINSNIDKKNVVETNNRIHYKKMSGFNIFLVTIIVIMGLFFISFYAVKYAKEFIDAGDTTTTTTTTESKLERSREYLTRDSIRKYLGDSRILIFLPTSFSNTYIELDTANNKIANRIISTYQINNDNVILEKNSEVLTLTEDGLSYVGSDGNNVLLKKNDSEYKYYQSDISLLLVMQSNNETFAYYKSNNSEFYGTYTENDSSIIVNSNSGNYVFTKTSDGISYNNSILLAK